MTAKGDKENKAQDKQNCMFCAYFFLDMGGGPFASFDATLNGADIVCFKGHWELNGFSREPDFRAAMVTAKECNDFELVEENEEGGVV